MSLTLITFLNGLAILAFGAVLAWTPGKLEHSLKAFPRSKAATLLCLGLATAWFLYHVTQLGEADYGNYRHLLFAGFLAVAILSYFWVPDFLAVRGFAVLILLVAKVNLDSAYMRWEHPQRLALVVFTYFMILLALYLAVSPYRVRDLLHWVYARPGRARLSGMIAGLCGLGLILLSFSYS